MGHSDSLNLQTITSMVLISGFLFFFFLAGSSTVIYFLLVDMGGGAVFLKDLKILSETRVFRFDPNLFLASLSLVLL